MSRTFPFVLIADDDEDDVLIFQSELETHDAAIRVVHLTNGRDVLRFLDNCPTLQLPDLVMLDYKMPGPTGADVLDELCANRRYDRLVKVVWSTSRIEKDEASCRRRGAFDYLVKPATNKDLSELTGKVMDILQMAIAMED